MVHTNVITKAGDLDAWVFWPISTLQVVIWPRTYAKKYIIMENGGVLKVGIVNSFFGYPLNVC